jgi:hypothetical protein
MALNKNKSKPTDPETPAADPIEELNKKVAKSLHGRVEVAEKQRRDLTNTWRRNVELLMGDIGTRTAVGADINTGDDDDLQSEINPDWYLTKTKRANLYSQVPQVQGTHENMQYAAAIPPFMKQLNYELGEKRSNVGVAMFETLADTINAAGIGFVMVDYVARFDEVDVPAIDVSMLSPDQVQMGIKAGLIPMIKAPKMVSDKFPITRIAPLDGIWPPDFAGSNFDDGDFVGYRGRVSEADAAHMFDLDDEQLQKAVTTSGSGRDETLRTSNTEARDRLSKKVVEFDRIFYWRHRFDKNEMSLKAIWEIVWVKGIKEPVKHEPWNGQRYDEQTGKYVGSCKFPVRICTLTYISDNPIVPSDTEAARPQTNDLRRSRTQLFQQRQRAIPLRWFNVNQIGQDIQSQIMDGTYQGWLPVNGTGERAVGEVARASYPSENFAFDQETQADLMNMWILPPAAMGQMPAGRKTSGEVQGANAGFGTVMGAEKARVQQFFLSIVEVLAGFLALYSEFDILTAEEKQRMEQTWDRQHVLHDLVLNIRPDAMIALDPQVRIQRLSQFLNLTVKSGYVAPKSIIIEMAELTGLDPNIVVVDPQPKPPDDPQISYRFSGKDDLTNVMVLATLMAKGHVPTPENINQAKLLLLDAANPQPQPPSAPGGPGVPGQPPGPGGPGGPPAAAPPHPPMAQPLHPAEAENHAGWALASKVAKRSRDMNGGA